MDELTIKEVHTRRDLRDFIYLPEKIHKNEVNWLPPIYMDEWKFFDRKKTDPSTMPMHCSCLLTGTINRSAGLWVLLTEGITLLTMSIMEDSVSWSVMTTRRPSMH